MTQNDKLSQVAGTLPDAKIMNGCFLANGPLPVTTFVEIADALDEGSVVSPRLAQIAGVTHAMGSKEAIDALIEDLMPQAIERAHEEYAGLGLSDEAIEWLAVGEQGVSSRAAFYHLVGVRPRLFDESESAAYPRDASDFKRVLDMVESVPEARGRLDELHELSHDWSLAIDELLIPAQNAQRATPGARL